MWIAPFVVFDGVHPTREEQPPQLLRPGHTDVNGVRQFPLITASPDGEDPLLRPFIEDRSSLERPVQLPVDERSTP